MDEKIFKTFMEYFFGTVGALVFAALVIRSGALPYALAGGGVASGVTFYISRQLPFTLVAGVFTALVILVAGVGLILSGG